MTLGLRKKISAFLVALTIFVVPVSQAQAVWPVSDWLGHVLQGLQTAAQYVSNLSTGVPGFGGATRTAVNAGKQPCVGIKAAFDLASAADAVPGLDIIAADAGQVTKLSIKISTLNGIRTCFRLILTALNTGAAAADIAGGLQAIEVINANEMDLGAEIRSLDKRIDDLIELRRQATKRMWEGVATRIFLTAQSRLVTTLINKLIAKYKIGNYLQYADALATQVYNIDFAKKNYPDQMDQAILKSIGGATSFSFNVSPQIRAKARQNIGVDFRTLDVNDPNFFAKMSVVGAGPSDPFVLNAFYASVNDGLQATGRDAARMELAQNQGIMSLRNCQGIVQQEIDFDRQWQTLVQDVQVKDNALNNLLQQQAVSPNLVSEADLKIADDALKLAVEKMQSFPQRNGNVYVKRCQDIANPGASISNSISAYLQSHLTAANSTDQKNMPFIAKFAEVVATNFIDRVIQHQIGGGSRMLSGSGFTEIDIPVNSYITPSTTARTLVSAENVSLNRALIFNAVIAPLPGQVTLDWNANSYENFDRVSITAAGFKYDSRSAVGNITVTAPSNSLFTITAYDVQGQIIGTTNVTSPVVTTAGINLPTGGGLESLIQLSGQAQGTLEGQGIIPPNPPPSTTPTNLTPDGMLITWESNGASGTDTQGRTWIIDANGQLIQTGGGGVQGAFIKRNLVDARGSVNNYVIQIR